MSNALPPALRKYLGDCTVFEAAQIINCLADRLDAIHKSLYDVAKDVCHEHGLPWTDPRTGKTHRPPKKYIRTRTGKKI